MKTVKHVVLIAGIGLSNCSNLFANPVNSTSYPDETVVSTTQTPLITDSPPVEEITTQITTEEMGTVSSEGTTEKSTAEITTAASTTSEITTAAPTTPEATTVVPTTKASATVTTRSKSTDVTGETATTPTPYPVTAPYRWCKLSELNPEHGIVATQVSILNDRGVLSRYTTQLARVTQRNRDGVDVQAGYYFQYYQNGYLPFWCPYYSDNYYYWLFRDNCG